MNKKFQVVSEEKLSEAQLIVKDLLVRSLENKYEAVVVVGFSADNQLFIKYTDGIPVIQLVGALEALKVSVLLDQTQDG